MAMMQTETARQAMIKAAALGATHSQRWEVLHNGHWQLFSLAFYDLDAPRNADGHSDRAAALALCIKAASAKGQAWADPGDGGDDFEDNIGPRFAHHSRRF